MKTLGLFMLSELLVVCPNIPNLIITDKLFSFCRFMSFCRVGTGLSDDELNTVVSKLKPYFR